MDFPYMLEELLETEMDARLEEKERQRRVSWQMATGGPVVTEV